MRISENAANEAWPAGKPAGHAVFWWSLQGGEPSREAEQGEVENFLKRKVAPIAPLDKNASLAANFRSFVATQRCIFEKAPGEKRLFLGKRQKSAARLAFLSTVALAGLRVTAFEAVRHRRSHQIAAS